MLYGSASDLNSDVAVRPIIVSGIKSEPCRYLSEHKTFGVNMWYDADEAKTMVPRDSSQSVSQSMRLTVESTETACRLLKRKEAALLCADCSARKGNHLLSAGSHIEY